LKNIHHDDPNTIKEIIQKIENMAGMPAIDLELPQDVQVKIRVNESVSPAKFKSDPLIPGGFIANSLTIRAMRPNLFVVGDSLEDLSEIYECACGQEFDIQFWKICPYCAKEIKC